MSSRVVLFALLVVVALVPERGSAQGGWTQFAAPDRSFSVLLPGVPETEPPATERGVKIFSWTLRTDYGLYLLIHSDYPSVPNVDAELRASMNNFASGLSGRVVTQRRHTFRAARGDMLPAIDFTYASEDAGGSGRIVVDGKRVYMWVAVIAKGHDRSADSARFLSSIAITAPAR